MAKGKKTGGRTQGTPNRVTRELKDMVMAALDKAGGVDYLAAQAEKTPSAFLPWSARSCPCTHTSAQTQRRSLS
jgi:hypothetical protein